MRKAMSKKRFKELRKRYMTKNTEDGDTSVIPWNEQPKDIQELQLQDSKKDIIEKKEDKNDN